MALDMEATLDQKALYYPLADRMCCDRMFRVVYLTNLQKLLAAALSIGFLDLIRYYPSLFTQCPS